MVNNVDIFEGCGVKVDIIDHQNFLKITETLTRMGVPSSEEFNTLYQSCHLLHKKDGEGESHYAILHFKEFFILDEKENKLDELDIARRNKIVKLLEEWKLLKILDHDSIINVATIDTLHIVPFRDKGKWDLESKYLLTHQWKKDKQGDADGNVK